jgi:pimeloyl-ACP methyl ester carboxylesterase
MGASDVESASSASKDVKYARQICRRSGRSRDDTAGASGMQHADSRGAYVRGMRVVLVHALPLTGAMWSNQLAWLPSSTIAPTLYDYGDSISDWATAVLNDVGTDDILVVGASV